MKQKVPEITRSKYAIRAIDAIFSRPIFQSVDFIGYSKIPKESAKRIWMGLKNAGVLEEMNENTRNKKINY